MKVVWTDEALREIAAIHAYIARDNPRAAAETVEAFLARVEELLPGNPHLGRPGRVAGTRELLLLRSYIAAYRISGEEITILTIRHAARLWPDNL